MPIRSGRSLAAALAITIAGAAGGTPTGDARAAGPVPGASALGDRVGRTLASPDGAVRIHRVGGYREYKDFSFSLGRYPRFRYRHHKSYRDPYYNGYYGRRRWGYHRGYHRGYRRHHPGHHILRGVLRSLPYLLAR